MRLFKQLLERQAGQWLPTEVFITVMDGFASALMGHENWHHLTEQAHLSPEQRRSEFIQLYIENLKQGIRNALALKFGMKNNQNRHIYHLIYVTCHIKGIKTMKTAMWNRTQTSTNMVFSEWVENRGEGENIVDKEPDQVAQCLYELIKSKFRGENVDGKTLDEYIWLCTPYISNVKNRLKNLLNEYATNRERAFEKIEYQFPLSCRRDITL